MSTTTAAAAGAGAGVAAGASQATTKAVSDNHYSNSTTEFKLEVIAVPVVFFLIFLIGIIGNGLLIFIVLRNKTMRTKPNVLIVSLAIGDFLLLLISVPVASTFYTTSQWIFGSAMCKINEFTQTLSLGVSIFTLVALSIDRFIAVVYPLASYSSRSLKRVLAASAIIWIVSFGLGLMDLVGAEVRLCQNCAINISICDVFPREWGNPYKHFRIIFRFIIYFGLPMIVIVCLYVIIAYVLLRQSETLSSSYAASGSGGGGGGGGDGKKTGSESSAIERQIESRKKIAKVVLSFVVIFVVCWLPRHIFIMFYYFGHKLQYNLGWHILKISAFCLIFIYSAVNPLALYLLNVEFRRYYHHYLFGCCYKPWRLQYSKRQTTAKDSEAAATGSGGGGRGGGCRGDSVGLQQTMVTSTSSLEDLQDSNECKGKSADNIQLKKLTSS